MAAAKKAKPVKKGEGMAKGLKSATRKAPANKPAKTNVKKVEGSGDTIKLLFQQARKMMNALGSDDPGDAGESFDYAGVIRLLDQILAIEPGSRDALNFKGIMYMGQGENEKAIECFDAVLKKNPADAEAQNNKGIALFGLGKVAEALRHVDRAIELDKRYPDALMNKAVILHGLGRVDEARKFLARAQALDTINA